MNISLRLLALALFITTTGIAGAAKRTLPCPQCAAWNEPHAPFKLYGNTYYVGTSGIASILITSGEGHVLIDAVLPESVEQIAANVRTLGFRVEDIKVILNTHAHDDHAGGLARMQKLTGAKVWASPWSAQALAAGISPDDPQFGVIEPVERVANVALLKDGDTVRVGPLALVAHFTPGHTGGGTSWTWKSCAGKRCLDLVYADSISAVSGPNFRFTGRTALLKEFDTSFATLSSLPCDILVTPHPEASGLWERLQKPDGLVDPSACRRYAQGARERLRKRLEDEAAH